MRMPAVILAAGAGSRVSELTHDRPKCLLPVGNQCLLWYAITTLRQVGISRMICLIPDKHESEIKQYCHKKFASYKELKLTFKTRPIDVDWGTADSLRSVADRIDGDCLVYSCDTIVDHTAVTGLINQHYLYDSAVAMLLSDQRLTSHLSATPVPGTKERAKISHDIIALETFDAFNGLSMPNSDKNSVAKVVFFKSDSRDMVKFNLKILSLHPELEVFSSYFDAHVYIFKRSIIEFIKNDNKKTLKGEVLPSLVTQQFHRPGGRPSMHDDDNDDGDCQDNGNDTTRALASSRDYYEDYYERDLEEKLRRLNPGQSDTDKRASNDHHHQIVCLAYIAPEGVVCHRANTIGTYMECNRHAKNILAKLGLKSTLGPSGKPSTDTVFGDSLNVGDKCLLKKSCIGNGCKFGDKVKIIDSVIMDNVEIESNVSISGSIISSGCKIGPKCDLKSCLIGAGQQVPASSRLNGESVMDDKYMIDFSSL